MNAKKVIDMAERRAQRDLKAFLKRCDEAAAAFPLYVLDADHKVVRAASVIEWGEFKRDFDANCRVAHTEVGNRWVSTVFLGTDCSYGFGKVPVVFETMIFGPNQSDVADRYETWDEAVAGHEAVVRSLTDAA